LLPEILTEVFLALVGENRSASSRRAIRLLVRKK
jgi:hypothetical protein